MKNTELRNPNSSTFGGMSAAKTGFSTSAKSTASANSEVIATSGAVIPVSGPRDKTARIRTIRSSRTAIPSFQAAMIIVACMPVLSTPKKKAIVNAWNGKTHSNNAMGSASSAPVLGVESARATAPKDISDLALHSTNSRRQIAGRSSVARAPIGVHSGSACHHEAEEQTEEGNGDRENGEIRPERFARDHASVDDRYPRCVVHLIE